MPRQGPEKDCLDRYTLIIVATDDQQSQCQLKDRGRT